MRLGGSFYVTAPNFVPIGQAVAKRSFLVIDLVIGDFSIFFQMTAIHYF